MEEARKIYIYIVCSKDIYTRPIPLIRCDYVHQVFRELGSGTSREVSFLIDDRL